MEREKAELTSRLESRKEARAAPEMLHPMSVDEKLEDPHPLKATARNPKNYSPLLTQGDAGMDPF